MSSGLDSSFDLTALADLRQRAVAAPAGKNAAQLQAAARQFESLFTQMLLKSMRAAGESFKSGAESSQQGDFYQDMFDQQLSLHLTKGPGLGLAEMLIEQLGRGQLAQDATTGDVATLDDRGPADASAGQGRVPKAGRHAASTASDHAAHVVDMRPYPNLAGFADIVVASATDRQSQRQFVAQMWPHAQAVARTLGVDPHAVLAQAVLETGWGRHVPQAGARSSHNLFGIKAGESWRGDSTQVITLEYESGRAVTRSERFRAYTGVADSFQDYAAVLGDQHRYAEVISSGQNVADFAQGLQRAGYATDPKYASKIIRLAGQLRDMTSQLPKMGSIDSRDMTTSDDIALQSGSVVGAAALKSVFAAPLSRDSLHRTDLRCMARGPGGELSDG